MEPGAVIDKLTPGDVLIKGANAVDPFGNVGVVMAGPGGGTMGQFYMALKAQGVATIYVVGLEKLIPSVEEAARYGGKMLLGRTIGCRVGMALVADGRIVTEIEAIEILFGSEGRPLRLRRLGGGGGLRHTDRRRGRGGCEPLPRLHRGDQGRAAPARGQGTLQGLRRPVQF